MDMWCEVEHINTTIVGAKSIIWYTTHITQITQLKFEYIVN
jgi:hypothetical protein